MLPGGDYASIMGVIHNLHCLVSALSKRSIEAALTKVFNSDVFVRPFILITTTPILLKCSELATWSTTVSLEFIQLPKERKLANLHRPLHRVSPNVADVQSRPDVLSSVLVSQPRPPAELAPQHATRMRELGGFVRRHAVSAIRVRRS